MVTYCWTLNLLILNPKKAKTFILPTAKKLNVDSELVENLMDYYWKEVRKALSELKAPRVTIANFGSFRIKSWKLDEQRLKYQYYLDKTVDDMTFATHKIKSDIEKRVNEIDALKVIVLDDAERKQQVKDKRNGKVDNNSLEK